MKYIHLHFRLELDKKIKTNLISVSETTVQPADRQHSIPIFMQSRLAVASLDYFSKFQTLTSQHKLDSAPALTRSF